MIPTADAYTIGKALIEDAKTTKNEQLKTKLLTLGCMLTLKCALRIKEESLERKAKELAEVAWICVELNNFELAKTLSSEAYRNRPDHETKKQIAKINAECRDAGY